ncbi:glycosyltransferase family 39 protein [Candidatus Woesebacteria bacterium]|nr:glycosyltransferase family 39 protein [Candidatus Woesebacteria bacterium]
MDSLKRLFIWFQSHALVSIIVLAIVLRLVNLSTNPPGLNWDEVSMGYSAYSILETGRDEWGVKFPILFRSYGEWKSPVYIYLIVPFIKIFGLNEWGVRLPAAIFGVFSVYLTYLLGKKLYSNEVGLWASFLLAVSPWHLMLSRPAFEAGVALTLIMAGIYLLLQKKPIIASLVLGLSLHTYHSAKIVVPFILLYFAYTLFKKIELKKVIISFLILGIFVYPIASDLLTGRSQKRFAQVGLTTDAELTERFFKYRTTFPLGDLGNKLVFNKYTFILSKGFSNWTSYLSPHFLLGSESIRAQHSIPFRGVLYLSEFALMCYGVMVLVKKHRGPALILPLLLIGVGFIPPALTKDLYHVLRSILTLPWWQLLAALGLVELKKNKFPYLKIVNWILIIEVVIFLMTYFIWYPKAFARDWQYGTKEMVTWVTSQEDNYKHIYVTKTYGEPQLFFAFYAKWDPAKYQEDNKKLIDYESLGYPWLDQLPEYTIGKYTFRDINWAKDNGQNERLFIGKADDFWGDTPRALEVKFPDGTTAYIAAEGK